MKIHISSSGGHSTGSFDIVLKIVYETEAHHCSGVQRHERMSNTQRPILILLILRSLNFNSEMLKLNTYQSIFQM